MVTCDRHGPCFVTTVQVAQEARRILHIAPRVEHGLYAGELLTMKVLIDLHATHVDQNGTALPCVLKGLQGILQPIEIMRLSLNVHGIGLQAALAPGFRQADRIEDALGDAVFGSRGTDCAFTGSAIGRGLRGKADQDESRERR